ncbi:hypothetical protein J6590_088992 [Homalodisca vitripennis]|nr:hypothetical protein J6590_088992 [Homalodisca vitripennis]
MEMVLSLMNAIDSTDDVSMTSDKERFHFGAFCDPESSDTSPFVENVCDSFNNFFASVGPRLARALHPSDPAVVDDADHAASIVFDFRPEEEMNKLP